MSATLLGRTRELVEQARSVYAGTPEAERLDLVRRRLDEPLRVALAGRVKAGKSTLLNALVGERVAPTDAGECTRIVTWYRDGHTYEVVLHPSDGPARQVAFHRDGGAIEIDLDGHNPEQIAHLDVSWPSQALRRATLVDTPGIGSLTDGLTNRARNFLAPEDEETPADAVLYLLRHLHRADLEFLRAFHDVEVSQPNPVNAVAVLSRADEIAVGRIDAMASAGRIAARMATDPNVRRLVQTVVPVAGLLAETAATLTEAEAAQLRRLAELTVDEVERLLLSADRFVRLHPGLGLTSIEREGLLARFGLFGLRLATALVRDRGMRTATELAPELARHSGIEDLRAILGSLFLERRDVLKSRSALLALDALTRVRPRPGSDLVAAEVEELTASAHVFQELRALSAIRAGWVTGRPDVLAELERLIGGGGGAAHRRLDQPADTEPARLAATATEALARWQRRAENPLTSHELMVAGRVAMRSCEGMVAALTSESS